MIFALINDARVQATPKSKAICPHCGKEVISKCGEFKIWHWAHKNSTNCDTWHENEGEWHIGWKTALGLENSEKRIVRNQVYHIADILTPSGVVIELQNSPISLIDIRKREEFYGNKMLWVVNGKAFKSKMFVSKTFLHRSKSQPKNFYYDETRLKQPSWIIDFGGLELKESQRKILGLSSFFFDQSANVWVNEFVASNVRWYSTFNEKIHEINDSLGISDLKQNERYFSWPRHSKIWENARRDVFIDLDDDHLLWLRKWIDNNGNGKGVLIEKEHFIRKYSVS